MGKAPPVIHVAQTGPERAGRRAARVLDAGGLVVFPASGLYGLAADAQNPGAVDRVFAAKKRPADLSLLVLVGSMAQVDNLAAQVPQAARVLMEALWPGGVTLVLPAAPGVPEALTGGRGTIGVRLPAHPAALAMVRALGRPVTGTSANVSGAPPCADPALLDPDILGRADLVLDADILSGKPSTVVDCTGGKPVVLRRGAVPESRIREILEGMQP
ncbi:MAG: threonylcarbamoyl-AMP synthase [Deltaproteobacteria bacterium]|nr:threonylcarbamoyl-AMP synthase [Deltaproteobacteria bacterium]